VLSWKHRDFIALARIAGAGHAYIIVRHILPNLANTMVVLCTLQVGWAIVVEASLTFLGAGVPPPTPTWGGMIAEGLDSLERAWWLTVVPGVVIAVVVFAFNLVGGLGARPARPGARQCLAPRSSRSATSRCRSRRGAERRPRWTA
jgi:peptide/nickel transport system permease protein